MKSSSIILLLSFIIPGNLFAQLYERQYDIPVMVGNTLMDNPWAGGLNSIQVSGFDANLDGLQDLFVFDRIGSRISIFINQNGTPGAIDYKYTREFNAAFPGNLKNWVLLRDMNCDGKMDICSNTGSGIKVYWNTSVTSLTFDPTPFGPILAHYDFGFNEYDGAAYNAASDIPAIDDYEGDGDMDIWSWNDDGGTGIYLYENLSNDLGDCSLMTFECRNRCYGKFGESTESFSLFLGSDFTCSFNVENPRGEENTGPMRHTGGSILTIDLDQNGLKDLVIGDVSEPNMISLQLMDGSDGIDSAFAGHDDFPATFDNTTAVNLLVFPSGYYVDVNNDGVKDLVVSPNVYNDGEDRSSVWLYPNSGTDDLPVFGFQMTNFLQKDMIDLGTGTFPIAFDVNSDGLKDLLVTNRIYFSTTEDYTNKISYYRNNGTASDPAFILEDNNWLDIPGDSLNAVFPSFGDMDSDGDADMIMGYQDGRFRYYNNIAGPGAPCVFQLVDELMKTTDNVTMDVGQTSTPQIVDLNDDGLLDIVSGEYNGQVNYFQNVGTAQDKAFIFVEDSVGHIDATSYLGIQGKSIPFFFKNGDGLWQLLMGTETGQINYYDQIEGNINGDFHLVTLNYENIREGDRTSIFLSDITNDGRMELFVGQIGGGVGIYKALPIGVAEINQRSELKLYPNPAQNTLWLEWNSYREKVQITIFDAAGRQMEQVQSFQSTTSVDISALPHGMYLLQLRNGDVVSHHRFVVVR